MRTVLRSHGRMLQTWCGERLCSLWFCGGLKCEHYERHEVDHASAVYHDSDHASTKCLFKKNGAVSKARTSSGVEPATGRLCPAEALNTLPSHNSPWSGC